MLDQNLIPTRLVEPTEARPIVIKQPSRPSRFHVLYLAWLFLRFFLGVFRLYLLRRLTRKEYARRLRLVFEHLGGLWIKLGQLLSLRTDVFSQEFCHELARLQDRAEGFPTKMVRDIIQSELGAPVETYFEEFEDAPFAAASIGQVHRARLKREQVWVAIKVQRPYAEEIVAHEMSFARFLVRIVEHLWFMPNLHWAELIWELNQILTEEIDYRYEATSTMRMRENLRKHKIHVHKVFYDYSSRRVLVTEFITAVLMTDYIRIRKTDPIRCERWHRENNVDPKLVSRRLFESLWRQLLEDNLFHGDLHPGNIVLLRDSRLGLIDFGAVGSMEREYQHKYTLLVQAFTHQDYAKASDILFLISGALPPTDLSEVKQKLIRCLRGWELRSFTKALPYHEKSMSALANELIRILFQYECTADWSFLRITRAQETVDQSLMHLNPEANYTKMMRRYFKKSGERARQARLNLTALGHLVDDAVTALTLPKTLAENAMFDGWILRRRAQIFRGSTSKISAFFAVLFSRIASIVFIFETYFLLVFLKQHHEDLVPSLAQRFISQELDAFPYLPPVTWTLILILGFWLLMTLLSMKRGFSKKERTTQQGE